MHYSLSIKSNSLFLKTSSLLKIFWITNFILMVFLLIFYIFQSNIIFVSSYQIKNFQKRINELNQENQILEIKLTKVNSLNNVEEKIKELGFEKPEKIHYFQIVESSVAIKK